MIFGRNIPFIQRSEAGTMSDTNHSAISQEMAAAIIRMMRSFLGSDAAASIIRGIVVRESSSEHERLMTEFQRKYLSNVEDLLGEAVRQQSQTLTKQIEHRFRLQASDIANEEVVAAVGKQLSRIEKHVVAVERDLNVTVAGQISSHLSNHPLMLGILQQHSTNMVSLMQKAYDETHAALEQKCREQLERIIREDQYRTINASLIAELKNQYQKEFDALKLANAMEFSRQAGATAKAVKDMMEALDKKATELKAAHDAFRDIQSRLDRQGHYITTITWTGVGIITACLVIMILRRKSLLY